MGLESWTQKERDRSREEGLKKGLLEGREEGRQAGREEGRIAGIRRALLLMIRTQDQTLCAASHDRLERCDDVQQLERWVDWVLQQPREEQLKLP